MNKDVMQLLLMQKTFQDIRDRILAAFLNDPASTLILNRVGYNKWNNDHSISVNCIEEQGCLFDLWDAGSYVDTIEQPWTASMIDAINGQPKPASPNEIWTQE
jgi:hypothetical protein